MTRKRQICELNRIAERLRRIPKRERTAALLVLTLLSWVIGCSAGGVRTDILAYQAITVMVIAWVAYKYANSADGHPQLGVSLAGRPSQSDLLATAREAMQQKLILRELLEELRRAEKAARPPFDLWSWERNSEKLNTSKELTQVETDKIASCYRHLTRENMENACWQRLATELEDLVDCVKRRRIYRIYSTFGDMEQDNVAVIRPVITMLESHLRQWCEFGAPEEPDTKRQDSLHIEDHRVAAIPLQGSKTLIL